MSTRLVLRTPDSRVKLDPGGVVKIITGGPRGADLTAGLAAETVARVAGDVASLAYTDAAIANLVNTAPAILDQFNEIAAALGNDPNFANTITNLVNTMAPQVALDAEVARATAAEQANTAAIVVNTGLINALDAAIDQANIAYVNTANVFTRGQRVNGTQAADVGVYVQNAAAQTADSFRATDSAGVLNARIGATGFLDIYRNGTMMRGYTSANDTQPAFSMTQAGGMSFGPGGSTAADVTLGRGGVGVLNVTGKLQCLANAANIIPLMVRGFAGQSANLQEWQDSTPSVVASMGSGGTFTAPTIIGSGSTANGVIRALNTGATSVAMVAKGAASQSADLQKWQDSTSADLATLGPTGIFSSLQTQAVYFADRFNTKGYFDTSQTGINFHLSNRVAANIPLLIKGFASQTADLTEWTDSAGAVKSRVDNIGRIGVNVAPTTVGASLAASPTSASAIIAVFRATASQTADLTQWQDSTGANVTHLTPGGAMIAEATFGSFQANYFTDRTNTSTFVSTNIANQGWQFFNRITTTVPVVVKGAASQTADLTQWVDSADGVRVSIGASGALVSPFSLANSFGRAALGATILTVGTGAVGNIGVVVRAVASQTANLQEWQDSAGTFLARVLPSGAMVAQGILQSNRAGAILQGGNAAAFQVTVGAAGGAAALPATPTKYMKVRDDAGTDFVVPMYAAA